MSSGSIFAFIIIEIYNRAKKLRCLKSYFVPKIDETCVYLLFTWFDYHLFLCLNNPCGFSAFSSFASDQLIKPVASPHLASLNDTTKSYCDRILHIKLQRNDLLLKGFQWVISVMPSWDRYRLRCTRDLKKWSLLVKFAFFSELNKTDKSI